MKPELIFLAPAVLALFSLGVILYTAMSRMKAVKRGDMKGTYYKLFQGDDKQPEALRLMERHIINLFEVPVLFYPAVVTYYVLGQVNLLAVILVWFFVVMRLVHSYVHMTSNRIMPRMRTFAMGMLSVGAIWLHIAVVVITG